MLVDVFATRERTPYRAFIKLRERLNNTSFALIYLPPYFDPYASFNLLRKTFGTKPFVALYTPYTGTDKISNDRLVANLFKTEKKESQIKVEVYSSVIQLTEGIERWNRRNTFVLLLLPINNENVVREFPLFALQKRELKVCGLVAGAYNERKLLLKTPIITNQGIFFNDGIVAVFFEPFEAECYAIIGFKPLGPPFEFKSKDPLTLGTVDQSDAAKFFQNILQKAGLKLTENHLMFLPLILGLRKNRVWHIRHPRRFVKKGVQFWGPLPEKGKFRFGLYIDIGQKVEKQALPLKRKLNTYEFALAFNCVGKKPFISPLYEFEKFIEHIQIPSTFIGSFGEFYTDETGKTHFLNGSLTVVFLKELRK